MTKENRNNPDDEILSQIKKQLDALPNLLDTFSDRIEGLQYISNGLREKVKVSGEKVETHGEQIAVLAKQILAIAEHSQLINNRVKTLEKVFVRLLDVLERHFERGQRG